MSSSSPPSTNPTTAATSSAPSPKPHFIDDNNVESNEAPATAYEPRYIDVGINLTDSTYGGVYHGSKKHDSDLADVISRAKAGHCKRLLVTGSDLAESRKALELAKEYPDYIYATVGVHPCSAHHFELPRHAPEGPALYLASLRSLALANKAHFAAFGEIGLDYDRLFLCAADIQRKYFIQQLDLAEELQLPLFLHSRAAAEDFGSILFPRLPKLQGGLVHSFTGTVEEMEALVSHGLYVGVNGCSLKTEENLEVVKRIPLDNLMLETDGPWCEIRPSHASAKLLREEKVKIEAGMPGGAPTKKWVKGKMMKGRNEPAAVSLVAHVIARLKGVEVEEVCEAAWRNTVRLYGLGLRGEEGKMVVDSERLESELEKVALAGGA